MTKTKNKQENQQHTSEMGDITQVPHPKEDSINHEPITFKPGIPEEHQDNSGLSTRERELRVLTELKKKLGYGAVPSYGVVASNHQPSSIHPSSASSPQPATGRSSATVTKDINATANSNSANHSLTIKTPDFDFKVFGN